jgi:hypothetical protein
VAVPRFTLASDDPAVTSLAILDDWDETDRCKVNIIAGQAGIAAGAGAVGVTVPRFTLASDDPAVTALQIIDDWDETDRCKVNIIAGQAGIAAGAGAVGVTVPRFTLASDDPAVTSLAILDDWDETDRCKVNIIAGQAGIAAGAGAVGVTVPRMTLASDDPAVTALQIIDDWDGVDDAAAGTDGARILGLAKSSQKTAVATGDNTLLVANVYGEQVNAGYVWSTDSNRIEETDPVNEQPVVDSIVNLQAITDGTTTAYAPSVDGLEMFGFKDLSLQLYLLGGVGTGPVDRTVTVTFECSNDVEVPAGTRIWVDISNAGYDVGTASSVVTSITHTGATSPVSKMIDFDNLNCKRFRVVYVYSGATAVTNGEAVINARRKAL